MLLSAADAMSAMRKSVHRLQRPMVGRLPKGGFTTPDRRLLSDPDVRPTIKEGRYLVDC